MQGCEHRGGRLVFQDKQFRARQAAGITPAAFFVAAFGSLGTAEPATRRLLRQKTWADGVPDSDESLRKSFQKSFADRHIEKRRMTL